MSTFARQAARQAAPPAAPQVRSAAPVHPGVPSYLLAAAAQLRAVLVALRHRAEIRRLCAWDDHQLKDIGLTRSAVMGALQAPLTRDPSLELAARAGGRRWCRYRSGRS